MNDTPTPGSGAASATRRLIQRVTGSPAFADLIARAVEVRWMDRALALAARLFIAVIPMAIVISSLAPGSETFAQRVIDGLDLTGPGRAAAEALFATPGTVRAGVSVFSLLVVAYALSSYGGELQRMYRAAWRVQPGETGDALGDIRRRLSWVLAFVGFVALSSALGSAHVGGALDLARDLVRTLLAVTFFGWTPYVLLGRRVSARQLWPTAVLSAAASGIFTAVAPVYVGPLINSNTDTYGLIGFTFTFFSLLFAQGVLITGAAIAGAWLGDRSPGTAAPAA